MKAYKIVIGLLLSAFLLPNLISCDKEERGEYVKLTVASRKGRLDDGAEWFYVKIGNEPYWTGWSVLPDMSQYEEGFEYKVLAIMTYADLGGVEMDGYGFNLRVMNIISQTQKDSEGLPDKDVYPSPFETTRH